MMTRLRLILGLCAVLMGVPFAAEAATYYVDRAIGSDSNTGLSQTAGASGPKRTIQSALNLASSPGDIVYVKNGTYTEKVWVKYGGTAGNPITISNYPGHSPVIDMATYVPTNSAGTGGDSDLRVFISNVAGSSTPLQYLIIQGFEITDGYDCIKFDVLGNSTIKNIYCHDNYGNGIIGPGALNVTITANRFVRVGAGYYAFALANGGCNGTHPCNQVHGLYLTGKNYTITNNIISDTQPGFGMQLAGYNSADYPTLPSSYLGFTGTIAHNTVAYGKNGAAMTMYRSGAINTIIENNIFYENDQLSYAGPNGISFFNSGAGHIVRNNIIYALAPGSTAAFTDNLGGKYTSTNNLINGTAPAMANAPTAVPATPDYSLTSTSPAIDAGFAGTGRPGFNGTKPDIGAFETLTATGGSVTANIASVQLDMNVFTPAILPNTTGWTVNNGRTVTGVALSGSSVANLTFSGAACAGESWTASYAPGTASDSALVGGTQNQLVKAFGPIALSNNCVSVGYTLTQTAGAIYGALLPQTTSPVITNVGAGSFFAVRTKWKATVADPPPLTTTLQYSITGEAGTYADVPDAYTAGNIRYAGLSSITGMDAHGTPVTTERLASTFSGMVAGAVIRCAVGCAVPTVDLTQDSESEQVGIMQLDTDATVGAVYWFRRVQSDGTVMTYAGGSTPSFTVSAPPILAAPVGLHEVGPASNTMVTLVWNPNTELNLLGYEIYQRLSGGAYSDTPTDTITAASAALRQSPMTLWSTVIPVAGTYQFVVKAIGNGIEQSAASNEVTAVRSGFAARSPIVTPRALREIGP